MLNLGQVLVNHNVEKWKLQDLKKLTIIIKFVFVAKHIFSRLLMSSFLLANRRKPIRSNHYPSLASSVRYFREDQNNLRQPKGRRRVKRNSVQNSGVTNTFTRIFHQQLEKFSHVSYDLKLYHLAKFSYKTFGLSTFSNLILFQNI